MAKKPSYADWSCKEIEREFDKCYRKYVDIADEIRPWYDIDKKKSYALYIWTKGDDGCNVFDIGADEIIFYNWCGPEEHVIIEAAWPAIKKIQKALKDMEKVGNYLRACNRGK